ncbi:MAG TPA: efflux RND transporter periplasmic adaptor subunit, partial [Sphingomonas sp.]
MKAGMALTLAMLLAACGSGEQADGEAKPVALVAIAPAQQGAVDETLTVYGAVEAGATGKHVLAAPAEATVVAIAAPVGTKVGAGQVVVRLAPSPTSRLDYAKAASDAAAAQAAYARAQRLRADGLVSDADVETAR